MVKTLINNELYLAYPDGFEVMDRAELKKAFLDDNPNRWGIKDEQRHMMITVLWNRTNMISALMVGPKTIADSAERKMKTSLSNSNYRFNGFTSQKINGRNTTGFSYEYVLEDVDQIGEVLILQNVNRYYMIYTYALKANQQKARVITDAVVASLKFTNDK